MASEAELKKSLRRYRRVTAVMCIIGFTLSGYALYVELAKSKNPSYNALCDISASISCSKVFTSEYGTGFGIIGKLLGDASVLNKPNGVYGMISYPLFFFLSLISIPFFAFVELVMGISGLIISVYLGYVLFYILEDACVVCITTYVVNFILFCCAFLNHRAIKKAYNQEDPDYTGYLDGKTKKRV